MRRLCPNGFSLVETLICVVIVGFSLLGIAGGIQFCLGATQSIREWNRSTDILLAEAEKLYLLSWDILISGQFETNFFARLYPLSTDFTETNMLSSAGSETIGAPSWLYALTNNNKQLSGSITNLDQMLTNLVNISTNPPSLNRSDANSAQTQETEEETQLDVSNPIYFGTIALHGIDENTVNNVSVASSFGYQTNLLRADLSVYWVGYSNKRLRTNTLSVNLSRHANVSHFYAQPTKSVPTDLQWSNVIEVLDQRHSTLTNSKALK